MTESIGTRTIGDRARELDDQILNLVAGRGAIDHYELKLEVASMSGRSGASANALASVALHQLEREGRIERSKSGKSWRIGAGSTRQEDTVEAIDHREISRRLTAEGHDQADIDAALDSMIQAGEMTYADEDELYLTEAELDVVRAQLESETAVEYKRQAEAERREREEEQ